MTSLKPMQLGEIVDRSVTVWRANWKALFQLFVGFQLAQYVVTKALGALALGVFERASGAKVDGLLEVLQLLQHPPVLTAWDAGLLVVTAGGASAALLTFGQVAAVAGTAHIYPRLTRGVGPSLGEAVRLAGRRLGATLGALALSLAWSLLVALLCLLPALAAGAATFFTASTGLAIATAGLTLLGTAVLAVWYIVRFILLAQVTAVEPLSALAIFRRTDVLSSGQIAPGLAGWVKGRLTILVTLIFTLLLIVSVVTSLPLALVTAGAGGDPSLALQVPAELLQVVATSAVAPLYVVFQTMFYVDMRVRREGLDLELALQQQAPA